MIFHLKYKELVKSSFFIVIHIDIKEINVIIKLIIDKVGDKVYIAIKDKFTTINQRAVADIVGITPATLCRIINGKQATTKTTAYCIVKAIHNEAKIEEYFIKKGE
jgi:DNA-binding XRE family transcriptional regulator